MTRPLTRADLDASVCDDCGRVSARMVLNGACHPDSPVVAIYEKERGALRLKCATCKANIGEIAVAPGGAA